MADRTSGIASLEAAAHLLEQLVARLEAECRVVGLHALDVEVRERGRAALRHDAARLDPAERQQVGHVGQLGDRARVRALFLRVHVLEVDDRIPGAVVEVLYLPVGVHDMVRVRAEKLAPVYDVEHAAVLAELVDLVDKTRTVDLVDLPERHGRAHHFQVVVCRAARAEHHLGEGIRRGDGHDLPVDVLVDYVRRACIGNELLEVSLPNLALARFHADHPPADEYESPELFKHTHIRSQIDVRH